MSSYPSLAEFLASAPASAGMPAWCPPGALPPAGLDAPATRARIDDVIDTVIELQRAEWLHDGVFVGPSTMPEIYKTVLYTSQRLGVPSPPAMVSGASTSSQGIFGTDGRSFLHLSTSFFGPASELEQRFMAGRFCGLAAARLVTPHTLYALIADHGGLRQVARAGVGPLLEVVLAPLSLGMRLVLSRWHRYAEVAADRAGLIVADDLNAAGSALLRIALGGDRGVDPAAYLAQLDALRADLSPGRFTQLLADQPFTHKRLRALSLFHRSEAFAEAGGRAAPGPLLSREALETETSRVLGVLA
jgi:hypothetical protein